MEKTLLLLKPSAVQRGLIGEIISRIEKKGLRLVGIKMMQLNDEILNEALCSFTAQIVFPEYQKQHDGIADSCDMLGRCRSGRSYPAHDWRN